MTIEVAEADEEGLAFDAKRSAQANGLRDRLKFGGELFTGGQGAIVERGRRGLTGEAVLKRVSEVGVASNLLLVNPLHQALIEAGPLSLEFCVEPI